MVGFGRFLFANSGNDNPDSNYGVDDYRPEGTFKGGRKEILIIIDNQNLISIGD